MEPHELYMSRCIQLAKLGKGKVAPNPMVGAVIVHEGKIIGEGYHQKYGESHAEVNAINSVEDKTLLHQSTIYVSLEPCAHYGKTPPCANLLVEHQFEKVVIGALDPHSKVDGKGMEIIKEGGIPVEYGILKEECEELNRYFFTFQKEGRPYVTLKWAQSSNGFLDNNGKQQWISQPENQVMVHHMRAFHQAILVGKNTVINDNPTLTVRKVSGQNPIRIVLDHQAETDENSNVYNNEAKSYIFCTSQSNRKNAIRLNNLRPASVLEQLRKMDIQSVLIEGGSQVLQSFIDAKLWDEAVIITGQQLFESGTEAPIIRGRLTKVQNQFGDHIHQYSRQ